MKTSIIILTHNQLELTKQCLDSIRKHTPEEYELILVDNGSTDETVSFLKTQPDVRLLCNETNAGFPKGCNEGAQAATGDHVLFLNNDTVVTRHWLRNLLRALHSRENIGIVGPVSNFVSGYQRIDVTYTELSMLDGFAESYCREHDGQMTEVRRLVGFCMLMEKAVFDRIGRFDEQYGLGNYEDDDLCFRVSRAGYTLLMVQDSFVHHVGHGTVTQLKDASLLQLLEQNRKRAMEKWGSAFTEELFKPVVSISLCMIVKDEEAVIARCLDSVKDLVEEIIVVDTGSTDRTKEIVMRYTEKIIDFEWIDDFAAARNFAFQHASKNYILWLDADDVLKEEDQLKLAELKRTLPMHVDSVTMKYHLAFDSQGRVTSMLRRNRLVKRSRGFRWYGAVHEYLQVGGQILNSDVAVTHLGDNRESDRNIRMYERRLANGEEFSPRDLYYYANELKDHRRYAEAVEVYRKFLDTKAGWIEDNIGACSKLADCYHHLGNEAMELEMTFHSFVYDVPRAEACCRLGYRFMQKKNWSQSRFWYDLATKLPEPANSWGLADTSCRTWLPHLQLCVVYDRLGQHEKAYEHNEIARSYRPEHPSVLHNKTYLEGMLGSKQK